MNTCLACKNKTSTDRCHAPCISGLAFCGRHVRSKTPRLWTVINRVDEKVTRIQSMWRGFAVRTRLSLAGPGVLKRGVCHNQEELVMLDDKSSVHPFNYFSFEEGGKVWWFDIRSIIGCLNSALVPLNPYTRQPLSMDVRMRLRTIYKYRIRHRLQTTHPASVKPIPELLEFQWLRLSQILVENGFEDARPALFNKLNKSQLYILLSYISRDMRELATEHPKTSMRYRYARSLKRECDLFYSFSNPRLQFATVMVNILHHSVDTYPICFIIMSALFRL
jgi:hypothetical protein